MNRHMILRGISLEVPGRRWEGCFFEALLKMNLLRGRT